MCPILRIWGWELELALPSESLEFWGEDGHGHRQLELQDRNTGSIWCWISCVRKSVLRTLIEGITEERTLATLKRLSAIRPSEREERERHYRSNQEFLHRQSMGYHTECLDFLSCYCTEYCWLITMDFLIVLEATCLKWGKNSQACLWRLERICSMPLS